MLKVAHSPIESRKDPKYPHCFQVATSRNRVFMFCGETEKEMNSWMEAFDGLIQIKEVRNRSFAFMVTQLETNRNSLAFQCTDKKTAMGHRPRRPYCLRHRDPPAQDPLPSRRLAVPSRCACPTSSSRAKTARRAPVSAMSPTPRPTRRSLALPRFPPLSLHRRPLLLLPPCWMRRASRLRKRRVSHIIFRLFYY